MKKLVTIVAFSMATSVAMVGCTQGNNTPGSTLVGAGAGALLGSQFGGGSGHVAGALAGAVVGGLVGNRIGQYMDRQDRVNMQRAIVDTPVGREAYWTNNKQRAEYRVRPTRDYHAAGRYCREYQTTVVVGGEQHKAFGTACRQPDGSWKIINRREG